MGEIVPGSSREKPIRIGISDDSCDFEVDVETVFKQQPELRVSDSWNSCMNTNKHWYWSYNWTLLIVSATRITRDFYAAVSSTGKADTIYLTPYLFCFIPLILNSLSKFMFREPNDRNNIGKVNPAAPVELALCDSDGKPEAVVMHVTGGRTLLPYKGDSKWFTPHNSRVEYIV